MNRAEGLAVAAIILVAITWMVLIAHVGEPQLQGQIAISADPTIVLMNGNLTANVPYRGIGFSNQLVMDNLSAGMVVKQLTNGTWTLANSSSNTSYSNLGIAVRLAAPGDRTSIITYGIVYNTTFIWSAGTPLYLNSTYGILNATQGIYTNNNTVGSALGTNIVFFRP
jgi:hypothetical protein